MRERGGPFPVRPSMAADATVRAPLRREKSSSARSFDADGLLDHGEDRGKSLSSAERIFWLTLACSPTQVFAARSGAHGARRRDGEQCGSQVKSFTCYY